MELRQLEHFLAVADTAGFTAAARRLHVVQSTVSVSVRALERELGARLFERTTRHVRLTPAGEVLRVEAARTLDAAAAAREAVSAVVEGRRGRVRLGLMHSLLGPDLAAALAGFRADLPLVRLEVSTDPAGSDGLVAAVAQGPLDLAIASRPRTDAEGVRTYLLSREAMRLAVPPGHPLAGRGVVALADLVGQPFVDVPLGWGSRARVDQAFAAAGLDRSVVVQVGDVATVLQLVDAGTGVALLAPSSAPHDPERRWVDTSPAPTFEVCLVVPRGRTTSAPARHLAALLRGEGPEGEPLR